jgi:hypothetical protein
VDQPTYGAASFSRPGQRHEVVCLGIDDPAARASHPHVIRIDTLEDGGRRRRWSVIDVIVAVRRGERFFMGSGIDVRPIVCRRCPMVTLATEPAEELLALERCADP